MKTFVSAGLILCTTLAASTVQASQSRGQTIGEAYDLNSDELLYRETHCLSSDANAREVIYQNDAGDLIAHKIVDYRSGDISPSFVQHNLYSQELIQVELTESEVVMSIRDARDPAQVKTASRAPDAELPVVIDAGFDTFIRENWDDLVEGATREFQFPFAMRKSLIELRIRPEQCTYETETDQCFQLEPANWLVRMLADPIELGYDADQRHLTRYRGLSNIGDAQGEGQVVDIRYDYQNVPAQACGLHNQTLSGAATSIDLSSLLNENL